MHPKNTAKRLEEGGGSSSLSSNSAPKMELGNSAAGLSGKVPQIWEIVLPADFNFFRIKTKNPLQTLKKVLPKAEVVAVSPPAKKSMAYFYLSEEEFKQLLNGESIKVTTTLTPFNGYGRGILEAWGTITISLNFFPDEGGRK